MAAVLDERIGKGDVVVENNGVKVVYTRTLFELLKNTHVDYVNSFFSKGFRAY